MRAEVAIAKVGEKSVQLDGFYGIKDLKLFIEVLQFMEAE